jgi:hypothetical protein
MNCKYKYFFDKNRWCSECLNELSDSREDDLLVDYEKLEHMYDVLLEEHKQLEEYCDDLESR